MIKTKITEIEKGCKERLGHWDCGDRALGNILYLCPSCQSKLNLLKEIQSEIKKVIDEMINKNKVYAIANKQSYYNGINADKLKEKLGV